MDSIATPDCRLVAPDTHCIEGWLPVPGLGVLAANAFVIHARQPVLVDTGIAAMRDGFMSRLRSVVDPQDLHWIWITHADPDHVGNLAAVLDEAPRARVVTNFLGMGKLGLLGLPTDRILLLNPDQRLYLGDRELVAVSPPTFDAPETTGLFDTRSRSLFSADCFGAVLDTPVETAADVTPSRLRDGLMLWSSVDAPWLSLTDASKFACTLDRYRALAPEHVLGSHLPAASGMLDTLLDHLAAARGLPAFAGPDQAALEAMLAAA